MKQIASVILLVTVASTTAFARIGETATELQDRYGNAGSSDTDELGHKTNEYLFKGYKIVVTFVNGQSEREKYYKEDDSPLVTDDINSLLAMNAEGATWKNTVNDKWKRSDDKLVAIFLDDFLDVVTNKYRDALKSAGQKKEDDSSTKDDSPTKDDNPSSVDGS